MATSEDFGSSASRIPTGAEATSPAYRICFNQAPHRPDWWTVEKLRVTTQRRLFRKPESVETWEPVFDVPRYLRGGASLIGMPTSLYTYQFATREAAAAWIAEDQKPRVHQCEAYLGEAA